MKTSAGSIGNYGHFSAVPTAAIQRSTFDRTHGVKSTFDEGQLIPIFVDEVLPGDTHQLGLTAFCRLNTLIKPIMDNVFLDFFFFFVPNRLVWSNWQKFCGEQLAPGDSVSYNIPLIQHPFAITERSLFDYFGLPLLASGTPIVNALPLRAYNLIFNQWFRDQNLVNPNVVNTGDGPDPAANYFVVQRGKRHDYFTSCLPQPQRGATPVSIPLGSTAPVTGIGTYPTFKFVGGTALGLNAAASSVNPPVTAFGTTSAGSGQNAQWGTTGLLADLSSATAVTVNALRLAFQTQRLLERDARGGTRYAEILRAHFGVTSPDARLQRPEYLGGGTLPVQVNPVAQTTATGQTGGTTPQANLAGYSLAAGSGIGFSKSFTEHGYIIGLVSARSDMTYYQGIEAMWRRRTRYDFYWPAFANLGEQAVYQTEIYADSAAAGDAIVFGYQERWAEYRYKPSRICGQFRPSAGTPLDVWHLAQKFTSAPTLNYSFISEPTGATAPMYRVLAVPSEPHFLFDAHIKLKSTRPMPTYSVPGLIDHM